MNRTTILATCCVGLIAGFPQTSNGQNASGKWCGSAAGYSHVMTLNVGGSGTASGSLLVNQQNKYSITGSVKGNAVNLRLGAATLAGTFSSGIQGSFCWAGGCAPIAYSRC
jgi:hypothetical protein